jgi:hypothetical protein
MTHPTCPTEKRCPTCGSDDPELRPLLTTATLDEKGIEHHPDTLSLACPDPFHSLPEPSEERDG